MSGIGTPCRPAYGDPTGAGPISGVLIGGDGQRRAVPAVAALAILSCIASLTAPHSSWAEGTDAKDEARALADGARGHIEALAGTAPDNATVPGYAGTAVPQTVYSATQLADPATRPADEASRGAAAAMTSLADRPELDPSKYGDAMAVMRDPSARFDLDRFLSGTYADCDPHRMTAPSTSTEQRCDAWRTTRNSSCYLNRRVDVEANVNYQCDEDSTRIHKTCERTLTKQCGRAGVCNTAGLRLESLQSDYGARVEPNGLILVGRAGTRTWCGDSCTTRTRNVRFSVNNRSAVRTFRVVNGGFDDWIHIRLNGHIVWVGHGDRSDAIRVDTYPDERCGWSGGRDGSYSCSTYHERAVFQGSRRIGWCERSRHWPIPALDLKPWLREGDNHLEIRIISTGCGDGYLRLQAQSSCCNAWRESWVETCN